MVALTMPLSIVQFAPLSVMVTGVLTAGLATTGGPSAARNAGTANDRDTKAVTRRPRGAAEKGVFMGGKIPQRDEARQGYFGMGMVSLA